MCDVRSIEASKKETLSLSLRLRVARARAWPDTFGKCSVFCPVSVRSLSGVCSGDTEIGIRRTRSQPWVVSFKIL